MKSKAKKLIPPLIIVSVIVLCGIWIVLQNVCADTGMYAEVRISGRVVERLSLNEPVKKVIQGENGIELTVIVSDGSVYVEKSECSDKICVKKGRISDSGDTIVCLPARVVVEVV